MGVGRWGEGGGGEGGRGRRLKGRQHASHELEKPKMIMSQDRLFTYL